MFKARLAADGLKRTTSLSDIQDNVATMLHDKQIKSAKKLAIDEHGFSISFSKLLFLPIF